MTTYTVSGQKEFLSAINSADGNDTIVLRGGDYGSVTIGEKYSSNVTITSASANDQAVFKSFVANGASNLTIDGVTFVGSLTGGYGAGVGLRLSRSNNITVEDVKFSNYKNGIEVYGTNNADILNNKISNISHDGMMLGHANNVLIQGNDIDMRAQPGTEHKDNIQFYNDGTLAPASNITIRNNTLSSDDEMTHGIYMGNADAKATGKASEFYENVLIENNSSATGQRLGLAVGETDGLTIRGNDVLQHAEIQSSRGINIPVILVAEDSNRVSITGNTVLETPSAANSGWVDTKAGGSWTISGNRIVSLGTDGGSGGGSSGGGTVAPSLPAGDGGADDFRYNGNNIDGRERVTFKNVDFKEGDRIILSNFDNGTFRHYAGDNAMAINADRNLVKLNSLVDIQELVTASADVKAVFETTNNTLVMRIAQDDGTLDIALPGFAAAYSQTFNSDLF